MLSYLIYSSNLITLKKIWKLQAKQRCGFSLNLWRNQKSTFRIIYHILSLKCRRHKHISLDVFIVTHLDIEFIWVKNYYRILSLTYTFFYIYNHHTRPQLYQKAKLFYFKTIYKDSINFKLYCENHNFPPTLWHSQAFRSIWIYSKCHTSVL